MPVSTDQPEFSDDSIKVVALAGGVGGAKMVDGLSQVLIPENLAVVVNTGDDFEHLGLHISPDLDTVCYTLAGIANPDTGWGRANETWQTMKAIEEMGGPTWFRLGDRDLGLHLERTRRMREGQSLSQVTEFFCQVFGIRSRVLPMTDQLVPTRVYTVDGELPFQEYFVHHHCEPKVTGFRFDGIERSKPTKGLLGTIQAADLVIICPSNPWVSIDPILSVPGIRPAVEKSVVLAISPIIGGQTIKGPAAKIYAELGIQPSAQAVAHHYGSLLDGIVLDKVDIGQAENIQKQGIKTCVTDILMKTPSDRTRLAKIVKNFGISLIKRS